MPANILNNLQTTIPGFFFSQAVFNLDATANGSATINAFDQSGTLFSFVLPLSGSGQNFFTLTTAGGEEISRVAFTSTVGLADVAQIRFGGVAAVPGPVVGAGLPGLIAACGALLALVGRLKIKHYVEQVRAALAQVGRITGIAAATSAISSSLWGRNSCNGGSNIVYCDAGLGRPGVMPDSCYACMSIYEEELPCSRASKTS